MERRIKPKLAAASLSLALVLAVFPALAGDDSWSVAGLPPGGNVTQLIVDPVHSNNLYAGAGAGVFKSTDSGATWDLVLPTLNPPSDLEIEPENPSVLYVAVGGDADQTLFRTTDGGQTWNEADNGIGTIFNGTEIDGVYIVGVDPVNDGVAYAATYNTGTYKTTDGGAHWQAMSGLATLTGANNSQIQKIIVDSVTPNVVYVQNTEWMDPTHTSTALSGLYVSTDSGAHWNATGWLGTDMDAVVLDPSDHTRLVTCSVGSSGLALYVSTNQGSTWTPGAACPANTFAMAIDPSDSQHIVFGTVYNGVYATPDGGTTVNAVSGIFAQYVAGVSFDPNTPANIYVSTISWGLFKSTDGGSTWASDDQGLSSVSVNQMLMGADGILYLASQGSGLFRSPDQGVTWTQIGTSLTSAIFNTGIDVNSIVEDPTANSTLYAGTLDSLFKTTDGGSTWTPLTTGLPTSPYVTQLALDPENTNVLYAAMGVGQGVYKSTDGGATWNSAANGIPIVVSSSSVAGTYVQTIATDPLHVGVVYAGLMNDASGLYKTADGGATWHESDTGMGAVGVYAIAVDPSDSDNVYASAGNGFYKSTDGGATWAESDTGLNGYLMTTIQIDPNQTSTLYLSENYPVGYGQPGYVFVSSDSGATWEPIAGSSTSAALTRSIRSPSARAAKAAPDAIPIAYGSVMVDPRHKGHLFASGDDGRVYKIDYVPTTSSSTSSGKGSGGKSGSGATAPASGGGGGNFGLLLIAGLAGFAARRRSVKAIHQA